MDKPSSAKPATAFPDAFPSADAFLDAFTRSGGGLISYVDSSGSLRYISNALAEWLGAEPGHLLGKSLVEIYGRKTYDQFGHWIDLALGGEDVHYERQATRGDGSS